MPGHWRAVAVSAPVARYLHHCHGNSHIVVGHFRYPVGCRSIAQRDLACRAGFRDRHGARCRHRRAGKHRSSPREGRGSCRGERSRNQPGLGCPACVDDDHGGHLQTYHVPGGCRGPDVCRPRPDDRDRRFDFAAGCDYDLADHGALPLHNREDPPANLGRLSPL